MSIVGQRAVNNNVNKNNRYLKLLESLKETNESILSECGYNGMDSLDVFRNEIANETLKNWFVSESCDESNMDFDSIQEHMQDMAEIFENNKEEHLRKVNEATTISNLNPTIGFNMAMHKNLLMNSVFKQAVPNSVAVTPKWTETFQREYLVTPKGERFDIALEQDKLTDAMNATVPSVDLEIKLPELGVTDIMAALKGSKIDKLSIATYISKVKVEVDPAYKTKHPELVTSGVIKSENLDGTGAKDYIAIDTKIDFVPAAYVQDFDRALTRQVDFTGIAKPLAGGGTVDIINGNFKSTGDQKVWITSACGLVKAVILSTKIDGSQGTIETCSTEWTSEDKIFEIPEGVALNTTITPDAVKDINALYNLNHVSLIMAQTQKILENYKDDTIRTFLDDSYNRLPNGRNKIFGSFNMEPRKDYAHDVVEYRKKSFMDLFESYATKMINALNDPDMSISVIGRTDIIRRLTPTDYIYQSPSSIGPITLDFKKNVYSSDNRNYSFVSSRKVKHDDLIMLLRPNQGNHRKTYTLNEYCFYLGNEIRNQQNLAVPAIHTYERFLMSEYQPVQGRVKILNPTGYDNAEYAGL